MNNRNCWNVYHFTCFYLYYLSPTHPLSLDKNRISDTVICLGVHTIDGVNQISLLIFHIINGSIIVGLPLRSFAACEYMRICFWKHENLLCQGKTLQVLKVFSFDFPYSFCDNFKCFKFFTNDSLLINKLPSNQTTEIIEKHIITTLILFKLKLNYWDVSLVHIQKQKARLGNYS